MIHVIDVDMMAYIQVLVTRRLHVSLKHPNQKKRKLVLCLVVMHSISH